MRQHVREGAEANEDPERLIRAAAGRKRRMAEIKMEINAFCEQPGLPPPNWIRAQEGPALK